MTEMIAPSAIRGQLIAEDLVSFGGRGGDTQFLAPPPMKIVSRLPLRNPGDMRSLYTLKIDEIIDYLVELGKVLDLSKNELMQEALEHSYAVTDLTPPILRWQYSLINHFLSRNMVRDYIEVPIGIRYVEGWQKTTLSDGRVVSIRAMGARALHIVSGNSPITSIIPVARNARTRSDAIIKSPSNDPFTALAVARSMIKMAPDHPVTKHLSVAYWKGGTEDFEQQLYQPKNLEKIIAWGGFASVKHVSRYIQPGLELISLDPKRSATIIGKEAFDDDDTMREVARRDATDIGVANQEGCANARVIYVLSGTDADGLANANRLGELIYRELTALPAIVSTPPRYPNRELLDHLESSRMNDDFYRVIGGEQREGAIVVSQLDEPVDYSPMLSGRVANIV